MPFYIMLALLIIFQIINSNLVHVSATGMVKDGEIGTLGLWVHIVLGILAKILTLLLYVLVFKKRGVKSFYPYLFGDFSQLKADFDQLRKGIWPESTPKGTANVVQGLGLLALIGTELTAIIWLILWRNHWVFANDYRELYKFCTGFVEVYVLVHGSLAIFRFLYEWKWLKRSWVLVFVVGVEDLVLRQQH